MQHIVFTVATDLSYNHRTIKFSSSLVNASYNVTHVGRKRRNSIAILATNYKQKRWFCIACKGKLFEFNLLENSGLRNYYSLPHRSFDDSHGYTTQICVNFLVYSQFNEVHKVAVLLNDTEQQTIANTINEHLANQRLWDELHENCKLAALKWNWEKKKKIN